MGKLVRDKTPDLIRASGRVPEIRLLDTDAYNAALHDKLLEEAAELRNAQTAADAITEIADVVEVLTAIVALHGKAFDDIEDLAVTKRNQRGAFEKQLWLEHADTRLQTTDGPIGSTDVDHPKDYEADIVVAIEAKLSPIRAAEVTVVPGRTRSNG